MKKLSIIVLTSLISLTSFGQEVDVKAKAILDKLSAKTKSYSTIKAEFQYSISNKSEGISEKQTGKIQLKGDHYFLSIQGQDIMSNGKGIWTVIKESEEIQINDMPDEDEEDYISPNNIFTLYEDGFKYKFVKEENGMQIINLYPKAAEEKSFHRIALYINKAKNQISKIKVYGKDGSVFTYTIKSFITNQAIPDSKFTFNKTKYPGYEIIDLRD